MDEQPSNISIETGSGAAAAQNNTGMPNRYVFVWRSQGLGSGSKGIDELIIALESAVDGLRLLKESGVQLDAGEAVGDDARLITTDPAVAQRFGFEAEVATPEVNDGATANDTTSAKAGA
jgi:hypothetical protein